TSSPASGCFLRSKSTILWPSSTPAPTAPSWAPTTTATCCQPKCSSTKASGPSSVAGRRWTMCSRLKADIGLLIAFEGLDQSGKQTQAERLRDRLTLGGRTVRLLSFPDYGTAIG